MNPLFSIDFYKTDTISQYPKHTDFVYSNLTPRSAKWAKLLDDYDNKVVVIGFQAYIKRVLIDDWNTHFFLKPKNVVVKRYKERLDRSLGKDRVSVEHIEALHDLGFLPLRIKTLPEGSRVNVKVPMLTVINTLPQFEWLTNYIETNMSTETWKPCTVATIAFEYKRLLAKYALETGCSLKDIERQAHDFSARGMSNAQDGAACGIGHLASFKATDTVSAIEYAEDYYNCEVEGYSSCATEHSVMCMGTKEGEFQTYKRLVSEIYPDGEVGIVSDTWNLWNVLTVYTKELKEIILNRQADKAGRKPKVLFRPDSGNPVDIICGDPTAEKDSPEYKGAMECLWDVFGGTKTKKGYKVLNEKVGLIYGDSITLERAKEILDRLKEKGFASTNIILGIGSFTYQFLTRDTFGFAVKATWGKINGESVEIFKDPITDSGVKKSAKGLLRVEKEGGDFVLYDEQTLEQEKQGALEVVFQDGQMIKETTFNQIKERLANSI